MKTKSILPFFIVNFSFFCFAQPQQNPETIFVNELNDIAKYTYKTHKSYFIVHDLIVLINLMRSRIKFCR